MTSPDLTGFAEAQQRLRDKLGMDIRFYAPIAGTYAPGTPVDPETGRSYDPRIRPLGSGFASAAVRCGVISRPFGAGGEAKTETNALGILDTKTVGLTMAPTEFVGVVAEATEFSYLDRRYKIVDDQRDELGIEDRHIVIGELK